VNKLYSKKIHLLLDQAESKARNTFVVKARDKKRKIWQKDGKKDCSQSNTSNYSEDANNSKIAKL
jgi:hypothetical protein